jgi:hypothetical protein
MGAIMWEQYKRTFVRMQVTIVLFVGAALFATRSGLLALTLLATMELFSAYGALWGARVKRFANSRRFAGSSVRLE